MRSLAWSFVGLLVSAPVLLVGCNKTNNIDTDNTTNNIYQKTIGSDGGPVGDLKGLGLYVPGGSVGEDIEISLGEAEEDEYPPLLSNAVGKVYKFEPVGTEFAAPVTVHLPFPETRPRYINSYGIKGGTWDFVGTNNSAEGSSYAFQTLTIGYFVLGDTDPSLIAPGGGGPKPGESCPRTEDLPEGFASLQGGSGTVADSNGAAVAAPVSSGYAVRDVLDQDRTRLQLFFGQRTESCVYGVSAGGSDDLFDDPIGAKNTSNFVVSLVLSATTPGIADELEGGTTYPRTDSGDEARSALVVFDDACKPNPPPAQQSGTSITIMSIDGDGVQGTLATEDAASGASMTATFNLKYCPLPSPPAARCCGG